jgi:hypothetical protein
MEAAAAAAAAATTAADIADSFRRFILVRFEFTAWPVKEGKEGPFERARKRLKVQRLRDFFSKIFAPLF